MRSPHTLRAPQPQRVTGGRGDGRLVGNERGNGLDGGPGRNLLIGRGGGDGLERATGAFVSCGAGDDQLAAWAASTYIPLRRALPSRRTRTHGDNEAFLLAPYPECRHGRLGFRIACPIGEGVRTACSAAVRVRARSDHRLLARGVLPFAPRHARVLGLRLTDLGRRRVSQATQRGGSISPPGRAVQRRSVECRWLASRCGRRGVASAPRALRMATLYRLYGKAAARASPRRRIATRRMRDSHRGSGRHRFLD